MIEGCKLAGRQADSASVRSSMDWFRFGTLSDRCDADCVWHRAAPEWVGARATCSGQRQV